MSHPARLSLRAPPHLPFIQGWPGIPESSNPSRKASTIDGTLEVRIGQTTIKAKWLRVELRKYESLPPGFPTSSQGETWEHVGAINNLWSAPQGKDYDSLEQGDFKFSLSLPQNIPSSVEMFRGTGVRYELVAALCYRQKGGMFKKEASPIIKASENIRIINHQYHSAWPLYLRPDTTVGSSHDLTLTVQRPSTAFGPGDRLLLTATLKSARAQPFQLKGFECQLLEICTAIPPPPDPKATSKKKRQSSQPFSKSRVVGSARVAISESVGRGGEKSARMDMAAPAADKLFLTVDYARVFKLEYKMEVKAVCQGVPEIKMGGISYVVGPFARPHAQQAVNDIGYVELLCPGAPLPPPKTSPGPQSMSTDVSSTPSPQPTSSRQPSFLNNFSPSPQPAYPPGAPPISKQPNTISYTPNRHDPTRPATFAGHPTPPIQGFSPSSSFQRQPSSGSTSTNTTTATATAAARPYSMVPISNPSFPVPAPSAYTPLKQDPISSPLMSSGSHDQSSDSHESRNKRYSTATSATFGRWDQDLRNAITPGGPGTPIPQAFTPSPVHSPQIPSTSTGPSPPPQRGPVPAWPSAEQEKTKLYADARTRAVVAQSASGASLGTIGMEPPPEYEFPPPGDPHYSPVQSVRATSVEPPTQSPPEPTAIPSQAGSSRQPVQTEYMSAAEEKEQQRKRFEAAQNRVASGSSQVDAISTPGSPTKSSRTSTHSAGPSRVDVAPMASGSAAPQTPKASGIGAVNENEQMRRFYEAQDRVARARDSLTPDRSMDGQGPNAQASGSTRVGMSTNVSGTAINEKEQMRRYHEAQDRVARAADGEASGSGSTQQRSKSPDKPRTSVEKPPPSALDEKEQMRRYYEARDRVSHVADSDGPSGSGSTPQRSASPEKPICRSPPTAVNEKEQMRRYHEAQDRVARAARGSPLPFSSTPLNPSEPSGPSSSFALASPDTPTPIAGPSNWVSSGSSSSPLVNGNSTGPGFMNAAEEKETMRKRFETAQQAVNQRMGGSGSPSPSQSFSTSPNLHSPEQVGYSGVSPLAKEVLARASTAKAKQARRSTGSDGPPPPLPVKPPMAYINLLSPVDEAPASFARWAPGRDTGSQIGGYERGIGIKMNGNGNGPPDGVKGEEDGEATSPVVLAKPLEESRASAQHAV